ncbi:DNA binding protein [Phytophthora cinnamomi]|uniref:DNA binding protein n=1 Tax=Phytophthora cinnamomi TaxID=4785 RepID=UPI00355A2E19|nr:DNA binding protein [Phytophthora cinnamomi]
MRKARILEGNRAGASTTEAVHYYYDNLSAALDELKLHGRPSQIWNCDETGVCAQGRCQQRVFTPKGMAANVQRSADRENVGIIGCINAAGDRLPPLYIFARRHRKAEWMENAPNGVVCAISDTFGINTSLFMQLKWFVCKLPLARPQLLILDGHFAHIDYNAVVWALRRDVHLFVLPAHTSHFPQPLDVGIYQPFKRLYENELASTRYNRQRRYPDRRDPNIDALNVVNIALRSSVTPTTKKRMSGTYVDENLSGGVLLTHEEMLEALHRKKKAKEDKEQAKAERALAKERAKVEKALQALEKERAKAERSQPREKAKEQRALDKRRVQKQRADEKERKVERTLQALRLKEQRQRQNQEKPEQLVATAAQSRIVASALV